MTLNDDVPISAINVKHSTYSSSNIKTNFDQVYMMGFYLADTCLKSLESRKIFMIISATKCNFVKVANAEFSEIFQKAFVL